MLILKEDEYYQVEDFCSFFGDYNKALSTIEELVKQDYLEKLELKRRRKGFTLYLKSDKPENFEDPVPVTFYLVRKGIGIVI